ncbi:MAG: hypothetical protein PF448_13050 [Bacteroidales bacterium]|jgi:hypothetical protein|nr:hypothetical protein [Bacteroidales bacterium]
MKKLTLLLTATLCIFLFSSCEKEGRKITIEYKAYCNEYPMYITVQDETGYLRTEEVYDEEWAHEFTGRTGEQLYLVVQGPEKKSEITAEVYIDGILDMEESMVSPNAIVILRGTAHIILASN